MISLHGKQWKYGWWLSGNKFNSYMKGFPSIIQNQRETRNKACPSHFLSHPPATSSITVDWVEFWLNVISPSYYSRMSWILLIILTTTPLTDDLADLLQRIYKYIPQPSKKFIFFGEMNGTLRWYQSHLSWNDRYYKVIPQQHRFEVTQAFAFEAY